jgi:hypothetical protein
MGTDLILPRPRLRFLLTVGVVPLTGPPSGMPELHIMGVHLLDLSKSFGFGDRGDLTFARTHLLRHTGLTAFGIPLVASSAAFKICCYLQLDGIEVIALTHRNPMIRCG